ncbi:C10 family peptidase [Bacteroides fluxus]|uniref:C10 family peptidase n=1 Tax=Bacteroides fluxus TaxID=626930 RepID=UPI002356DF1A|nr:C10 family peptidase [Bacteroides fluxus]
MKTFFLKLLGISLLLASCQKSTDLLQELAIDTKNIAETTETESDHKVSAKEATKMAELFVSKAANTRSITPQISDIQTIMGDNSEVLMYAINFANNSGYVVVSATKKYYPILAYAEEGRFNTNQKGVDIWLEDEMSMMKACLNDTTVTHNIEWLQYAKRKEVSSNYKIATRVESAYPETLEWWWMEVGNELTHPDYHSDYEDSHALSGELVGNYFCHVDEAQNMLPDCSSIYDEMAELCRIYGFSEKDIIYHIRCFSEKTIVNPLLITNWTQDWPYNWKVKKSLGCVTIATAQIMFHHRKPVYYNWDRININNYETEEQGNFFKELGEKLGIDYNTNDAGSDIEKAKNILQSYGYTVNEKDDCSSEQIYFALKANQPVYMRGRTHQILGFDAGSGHAWVCDGYEYNRTTYVLTVYAPFDSHPDSKGLYATNPYLPQFNHYGSAGSSTLYYHMNWGWGENNNKMWNRAGDYTAPNGKVYKRNKKYLFVKP